MSTKLQRRRLAIRGYIWATIGFAGILLISLIKPRWNNELLGVFFIAIPNILFLIGFIAGTIYLISSFFSKEEVSKPPGRYTTEED